MDSIFSILSHKDYDEPTEAVAIKRYVQEHFKTTVGVQVRDKDIIVNVPNASLATTLRLQSSQLKRECQLKKRLVIRIF